nr:hypothetical protein [Gammaproteobacteria bacterium]
LSCFSYICALVEWMHFLDRMVVLKEITRLKDPIHIRAGRTLEARFTVMEHRITSGIAVGFEPLITGKGARLI